MFVKLALILLGALLLPQFAFAQTTDVPTMPNTPSTNGTDLNLAIGTLATVGLAATGLYFRDIKDKKDVTKSIKGTDVDMANWVALMMKLFQYASVYKNYTLDQLLLLPSTNNPIDKTTLGQAFSNEANNWANFVQTEYGVPRPPMAIPSQSIVTAVQNATPPPASQETKTP